MQGFNMGRYVPPDQEGLVSGNRLLGNRAQKANGDGVPIVRFEMPFAVWCDGCEARTVGRDGKTHPVLIGQGVRFNAEKHRTGNYYSTPILTFRMRHPACGTWLAIRTDPAATSYVVVEGGRRRREYNDDEDGEGEGTFLDPASAAAASAAALTGTPQDTATDGLDAAADRLNAFDRLERTILHRTAATAATAAAIDGTRRIDDLTRHSARQWEDPYARNRALRAAFRSGRHAREKAAADDEDLRKRLGGLSEDLHLLPATEMDARYAALIDFGSKGGGDGGNETPRDVADRRTLAKPLFAGGEHAERGRLGTARRPGRSSGLGMSVSLPSLPTPSSRNHAYAPTTEAAKRQRSIRDHLASTVLANTRLTTDPFLEALGRSGGSNGRGGDGRAAATTAAKTKVPLMGLKRSVTANEVEQKTTPGDNASSSTTSAGLKRKRGSGEEADDAERKVATASLVSYDSD